MTRRQKLREQICFRRDVIKLLALSTAGKEEGATERIPLPPLRYEGIPANLVKVFVAWVDRAVKGVFLVGILEDVVFRFSCFEPWSTAAPLSRLSCPKYRERSEAMDSQESQYRTSSVKKN